MAETRIFTYGRLNNLVTKPGQNFLPGAFTNAYGIQYGAGAFALNGVRFEFGEAVKIAGETNRAYNIERVDGTTTAGQLGVVIRDVVGVRSMEDTIATGPAKDVPLTIVPFVAPHGWAIAVPLAEGEIPVVGGTVYVGNGEEDTIAGAFYATPVVDGTIETEYKFIGLAYNPTSSASQCAIISKI